MKKLSVEYLEQKAKDCFCSFDCKIDDYLVRFKGVGANNGFEFAGSVWGLNLGTGVDIDTKNQWLVEIWLDVPRTEKGYESLIDYGRYYLMEVSKEIDKEDLFFLCIRVFRISDEKQYRACITNVKVGE